MKKFLLLYREGVPATPPTPEQMQQVMKVWTDWIEEGYRSKILFDVGDSLALDHAHVYRADGVRTDGPYVETKEVCGGYSIAQADSVDAIDAFIKGCPIFADGGSVEVRLMNGVGESMTP